MAHAIFNVSPVKFLSSIQDHVFTVTPTFKNKTYKADKRKPYQTQDDDARHSSASPVTLQLTSPTESIETQMIEIQRPYEQRPTSVPLSPSAVPIDIPRSYPSHIPTNTNYEAGLVMPNNLLSTSYNSHNSYSYQQDHNLISLANGITQSPYLPAEDLTLCFDGLAVRSPTGSFYSNGGIYSPRQINSPVNIGSPSYNDTYVGSPSYNDTFVGSSSYHDPSFLNDASFVGSPSFNNNSFVGSPNSPSQFLGSPSLAPTYNHELGIDTSFSGGSYGFTYLSPSLPPSLPPQQTQLSPINSPSPTGSYSNNNNNLYLFPPSTSSYSRPTSPVPDDVILTASEVNDYINSPYLSPSVSTTAHLLNTEGNNVSGSRDDMELYPSSTVTPSSPHTQPQHTLFFSEDDIEDEEEDVNTRKIQMTTPSGRRAKIHKCPYCNHTSNRANNMREHTQIHNPNRPKPYACKLCNRAFARKHDMNRHHIACKKSKAGNNRYIVT